MIHGRFQIINQSDIFILKQTPNCKYPRFLVLKFTYRRRQLNIILRSMEWSVNLLNSSEIILSTSNSWSPSTKSCDREGKASAWNITLPTHTTKIIRMSTWKIKFLINYSKLTKPYWIPYLNHSIPLLNLTQKPLLPYTPALVPLLLHKKLSTWKNNTSSASTVSL